MNKPGNQRSKKNRRLPAVGGRPLPICLWSVMFRKKVRVAIKLTAARSRGAARIEIRRAGWSNIWRPKSRSYPRGRSPQLACKSGSRADAELRRSARPGTLAFRASLSVEEDPCDGPHATSGLPMRSYQGIAVLCK